MGKYDFVSLSRDEEHLTETDINAVVEDFLIGLSQKEWPRTLDVWLWRRHTVTEEHIKLFARRTLDSLLEDLDEHEELGHPEHPVELANPEGGMVLAKAFVGWVLADRGPLYYCERLKEPISINVYGWVQANAPSWLGRE